MNATRGEPGIRSSASVPDPKSAVLLPGRAFTLIELLVTTTAIALLASMLVPGLRRAREQSRSVVCASNIRQAATANSMYSVDQSGRYCPAAIRLKTENLHRWHGSRLATGQPFDSRWGPLAPYLGVDRQIRACPSFRDFVPDGEAAFEKGCGGYGYNLAYLGRVLRRGNGGSFAVVTDLSGAAGEIVRRPGETVMFADAALAALSRGVIEYSFAEPRFHPEYLPRRARPDPSIHFRHGRRANIAWCDGHVAGEKLGYTWSSGLYEGDADRENLGWFGPRDDNGWFDLD